jgi:pimeloyl-ACP methyl ester carboxylesterase
MNKILFWVGMISSFFILNTAAFAEQEPQKSLQQWMTLPATPTLPPAESSGYASINNVKIWYAVFGHGRPVILLHGGLANANYWGKLVPQLAKKYQVIVMDSRCHGRSTCSDQPISYDLMASDVMGLMDVLKIKQAAIIGWSDGAIIGLDLAINHPDRLTQLFSFAANSNPSGDADYGNSPVFNAFIARASKEYQDLSPTPKGYAAFLKNITHMWATQPYFTAKQLQNIKVPTWIVDADHDEAIKRENTEYMAKMIPNSGFLLLPEVSHFAFIQDPEQFNWSVLHFLSHVPPQN